VVARCNNLRKLALHRIRADNLDLSNCSSLQSVTLKNARVQKLQILSGAITGRCASSLQSFKVSDCKTSAEIPGLDQLIGLERLVLKGCSIKELPDLQNLTRLQVLKLEGGLEVGGMCNPPQLQGFPALRHLAFQWCKISSRSPNYILGLAIICDEENGARMMS
jgi:Leucine-rich repeat (LRR) protein